MTDFKTSDRDVNRAIRSWLHEDRHEDVSRVAGAVLDQVETIPQRRATWWPAWRTPTMNKLVTYGLGAAAVVVLLFAGSQLFGSSSGLFGTQPSPTPKPTLGPTPSSGASLPVGSSHVLWDGQQGAGPNFGINIAVTIPAPGWFGDVGEGILKKNDNADAPDGAGVTAYARTNDILVGLGDVYVYGDPCHWASTKPDSPVTTLDEAMAVAQEADEDPLDHVALADDDLADLGHDVVDEPALLLDERVYGLDVLGRLHRFSRSGTNPAGWRRIPGNPARWRAGSTA